MNMQAKYSKRGLTLVELIVSMALLSLAIAVAFAALFFGTRIFKSGNTQSAIQADLRLASDVIRDETRYASDLVILDALPGTMQSDKSYIYLSADGKALMITSGGSPRSIIDYAATQNMIDVVFSKDELTGKVIIFSSDIAGNKEGENVLQYSLQAHAGQQGKTYSLNSNVMLLNYRTEQPNLVALEPPKATPAEGQVSAGAAITLTTAPGFLIYYTMDGSDPTIQDALAYSETGPIILFSNTTIKAYAVKEDGSETSAIVTYEYIVPSVPWPTEPEIQPPEVSTLKLDGKKNPKAGDILTATYLYSQPDYVPQGASIVEWFSKKADGSDVRSELVAYHVPGTGISFKLTVASAMASREVYFTVTPIAQADASSPAVAGETQVCPSTVTVHKDA